MLTNSHYFLSKLFAFAFQFLVFVIIKVIIVKKSLLCYGYPPLLFKIFVSFLSLLHFFVAFFNYRSLFLTDLVGFVNQCSLFVNLGIIFEFIRLSVINYSHLNIRFFFIQVTIIKVLFLLMFSL